MYTEARILVDIHDTMSCLSNGDSSLLVSTDRDTLTIDQRNRLTTAAANRTSNPNTFGMDYSQILRPDIPSNLQDEGEDSLVLRSIINAEVMNKWALPTSLDQLTPDTDEYRYYLERVAPFELSSRITERLRILTRCNVSLSILTSVSWSNWGFFWEKFIERESDLFDPELIASVRPDIVNQPILAKGAVPAARRPYERSLMIENDPRVIAETEKYCLGFLVPYTEEDLSKLAPDQQQIFRMLFKYMRNKIVLLSDDPEKDIKELLGLVYSV